MATNGTGACTLSCSELTEAHDLALSNETSSSPVAIAVHTLSQLGFNPSSSVDFSSAEGDSFSFIKHSPALIARVITDSAIEHSV